MIPTFAACLVCAASQTDIASALSISGLKEFLLACKQPNGSFAAEVGSPESDARVTYSATVVGALSGILSSDPGIFVGTADFLLACQAFDGGIAAYPGAESHAGYTYCALAALELLGHLQDLDLTMLAQWAAMRQEPLEGGFNGRPNKLVDACYSFWMAGTHAVLARHRLPGVDRPILSPAPAPANEEVAAADRPAPSPRFAPLYSPVRLQEYLLACCQNATGGLRDKPGMHADIYHTCYGLAGLALAQEAGPLLGPEANRLPCVEPALNVPASAVSLG
jgi:protein farnesyltransferase subunit beta